MVDRISQIYSSGAIQPPQNPHATDKGQKAQVERATHPAARLVPDLKDRVEISEEGREAAKSHDAFGEERLPRETTRPIEDSWYSVGFRAASEAVSNQ